MAMRSPRTASAYSSARQEIRAKLGMITPSFTADALMRTAEQETLADAQLYAVVDNSDQYAPSILRLHATPEAARADVERAYRKAGTVVGTPRPKVTWITPDGGGPIVPIINGTARDDLMIITVRLGEDISYG